MTKIKDTVSRLAIEHRDLHSSVSKVGKSIDRNFTQDFAACSRENVFNNAEKMQIINKVICKHYYRLDIKYYHYTIIYLTYILGKVCTT